MTADPKRPAAPRVVLFLCVENAARSLMAEAIFNARRVPGWTAVSAGTRPADRANPRTGPMLAEIGLSLPPHPPREVTDALMTGAARRVTMGCWDDASCPARWQGLPMDDWRLPDPAHSDDAGFRRIRDDLVRRVGALAAELARAE